MFDSLKNHFSRHIQLSPKEEDIVHSLFRHRKFRKHQFILQEGEVCRHESFIVKGLTRTYQLDAKGQEHVWQFGLEDWWVGDLVSFLSGTPSLVNIACLEDVDVLQIAKDDLEQLYLRVPAFERYFRILIQNAYLTAMNRVGAGLSLSAGERYADFIQRYPHIGERVSDKQIASFLGITPQSLSRLRRPPTLP